MADIGGFLAGLLGGFGEGYQRAGEENRRISLMKKQLENQKAIQEGQLSLQRQQMDMNSRLADRSFGLDERRVSLAEKGQQFEQEQTNEARAFEFAKMGYADALQKGNMQLAQQHQTTMLGLEHFLREQGSETNVGREIRIAQARAAIGDESARKLAGLQFDNEKILLGLKSEDERKSFLFKENAQNINKLKMYAVERSGGESDDIKRMIDSMRMLEAKVAAELPEKLPAFSAYVKGLGLEADYARANKTLTQGLQSGLRLLQDTDPDTAMTRIVEVMEGIQDWSKVGAVGAGPKAAGKIKLTAPAKETGKAETDTPKIKLTSTEDVGNLYLKYPGLKADVEAEFKASPHLVEKYHRSIQGTPPESRRLSAGINFLKESLQAAEGATLDEKIANMKKSWPNYRRSRIGTEFKEIDTNDGAGGNDPRSRPSGDGWMWKQDRSGRLYTVPPHCPDGSCPPGRWVRK